MTDTDELLSHADGPTHTVTINRPRRRNALTPNLARAIAQEIETIVDGGTAQTIVLRGAGGHFCAGLDLHWLQQLGPMPTIPELQHGLSDFQSAILAIVRCPMPVVAVVEGTAAGFGLDLAIACDMRLAARSASFTSAFARMGLVPDGGSTFTLLPLIGLGRAMRLLMTGETIAADAALRIGLVEEVADDVELDGAIATLLRGMQINDPMSLRTIKRLMRAAELGVIEQALSSEGAAQLQALQSPAFHARLAAFTARTSERGKTDSQ